MSRIARIIFLAVCTGLLAFGLLRERHTVHSLAGGEAQRIRATEFTKGATVDEYMLRDSRLFDVYSLSNTTADEKDCKT